MADHNEMRSEMTVRLVGYMPSGRVGGVLEVQDENFPGPEYLRKIQEAATRLARYFFSEIVPALDDGRYEALYRPKPAHCSTMIKFTLPVSETRIITVAVSGISKTFELSMPVWVEFFLIRLDAILYDIAEIYEVENNLRDRRRWVQLQMERIREKYNIPTPADASG